MSIIYTYENQGDQLAYLTREVARLNDELSAARAHLEHMQQTIYAMSMEISKRGTMVIKAANSTSRVALDLFREVADFPIKGPIRPQVVLNAALWLSNTMSFLRDTVFPETPATTLGAEPN